MYKIIFRTPEKCKFWQQELTYKLITTKLLIVQMSQSITESEKIGFFRFYGKFRCKFKQLG